MSSSGNGILISRLLLAHFHPRLCHEDNRSIFMLCVAVCSGITPYSPVSCQSSLASACTDEECDQTYLQTYHLPQLQIYLGTLTF